MNPSRPEMDDPESWAEVEGALRGAAMLAPAPGFSRRWRLRLAASRTRRASRQSSWSLALSLSGALVALALWILIGPLGSPVDLTVELALRAAAWGLRLEIIAGLLEAVLGSLPGALPAAAGLGVLFTAGWLGTLGLASIYRLGFQRIRNGG